MCALYNPKHFVYVTLWTDTIIIILFTDEENEAKRDK